jgi:branched-subunit amino acid transport protein
MTAPTALTTLLLLALGCWVLKVLFVAVVPGERLPAGVRAGLEHLPPAVLAALVASTAMAAVRGDTTAIGLAALAGLVLAGVVYRATGRLVLGIGTACAAVVLIDLVLVPVIGA